MLKRSLVIFVMALAIPGFAFADALTHRQVAKEFYDLTNSSEMADAEMRDAINNMLAGVPNKEKYQDIIEEVTNKHLSFARVEDQLIDLHVQLFTEPELRELVEFCKTPVGKKYIQATPELNKRTREVMMPLMQETMQELSAKISERAKAEYEKTHPAE